MHADLWANKNVSFKPDFIQKTQDFYGAKVTQPDVGDAGAPPIINSSVQQNTSGKTDRIVEQLAPDASV
ncbi:serpin family protein [Kamptonema formosum]|uniref:serpin family protein n=1 Tax=Kamptonema formosum TaxID=331992 RepID=UPI000346E638